MKKAGLILTMVLLTSIALIAQTATEIARNSISSTVSIVALDNNLQPLGYGSGFIIDDNLIATNVHVIENASSVYVVINGIQKNLNVEGYVAIDKANDLIILQVSNLQGNKLSFGTASLPDIGEKIYAVGNPKGLNGTFSEGIISGIRDINGNKALQITAPISPGSSGGPVLNTIGQVIGIAFASYTNGQNLNFAIPITYLINLKSKISFLQPISMVKKKIELNKITSIDKEGVSVRILPSSRELFDGVSYQPSLSIKNNLPNAVSNIRVLVLLFDKTGTLIDSDEDTYFPYDSNNDENKLIKPYLARTYYSKLNINWVSGYKLKARILNYKIIER
jgi:hypothetical protein